MQYIIHTSASRGQAYHGWLKSRHSFSFAHYFNPERMHFGVLRVLNDDQIAGGMGFGTHPHDNMEIITIPLKGDLEHQDSMGNVAVIKEGEVQVLSAGTGITHSEKNKNQDQEVHLLQIWLFPRQQNVKPRYDQISVKDIAVKDEFYQILSPNKEDQGVWIHQDAWFHMGDFSRGIEKEYLLKQKENGVYVFVLEGNLEVEGQQLNRRDGMGIWETDSLRVKALSEARVLLMEVPMQLA
ncbi:pirin family protein [Mesonia sp. HuA40]|uniref:pirin family protein n=1 Tax=Mesonia sp. HuA40 TaxID=2602761 RepID=UPI0011C946B3|nr:pirin family protein [Mesonia sp. HuA40]TXK70860.1 pirin family protein [Mesonia sp. HuA40]